MRRSGTHLLVIGLLTLSLGACAAGGRPDATSTTPASTPSPVGSTPTAEPTVTEPAPDPSDPTTWIISEDGVGPIRLGEPVSEIVAALPDFPVPDDAAANCPNPFITFLGPPGASTADGGILLAAPEDGRLVAVVISFEGPVTAEGIGLNSTVEEARAAYPALVESLRAGVTPQYTLESETGWITFQSGGVDPSVIDLISVIDGGTPPNEYCG